MNEVTSVKISQIVQEKTTEAQSTVFKEPEQQWKTANECDLTGGQKHEEKYLCKRTHLTAICGHKKPRNKELRE